MKKLARVGPIFVLLALLLCLSVSAAEPASRLYQTPLIRNTTEEFPVYSSLFSGSPPEWSDAAVFRDGVYEGYYAQLDGISQLFYDRLKDLLADPAAAYTGDNREDYALSSTVSVPCYVIELTYPEGVSFPAGTGSSENAAVQDAGSTAWKYVITAYDALSRDHPEMPWLSCCYGFNAGFYATDPVYSGGQYTCYVDTDQPFLLYLVNPSSTVLTGCADGSYQSAVDSAVAALNSDSGLYDLDAPDKTTYDKAKGIHDYLCRTITYAYDNDATTGFDQCSYGALVSPYKTVCAGYASSAKALCDIYGVPCVEVSGLGGERHAWNNVRMENGAWYAMDCTWDDMGSSPIYDFFLKGGADPVPCGWVSAGSVPFPESHIAVSTWSYYTAMPYPELSQGDYVGYYLAQPPAAATATYGATYADVTVTGAAVRVSETDETPVTGTWFLGDWTDRENLFSALPAQESYPTELQATVYFSQNADFDPYHIYDEPYDYPLTATVPLTVTQAPLTIRSATVSSGAVTAVTFDGLKHDDTLTLGVDYTATAVQNGAYYDVTVTLLDTDLAKNYTLETATFNTGSTSASSGASPTSYICSHSRLALTTGQSQKVSLAFFPASATALPAVTWSSGDAAVATVDRTGLVTAVAEGSCTVTAAVSGYSSKTTISVTVTRDPAPTGLTLDKTEAYLTLGNGETEQLTATILPAGADGVVKWSSDYYPATVSDTGLVTPAAIGSAMISATLYAGEADAEASKNAIAEAQCIVSVFSGDVPAAKVTLNKSYLALKRGGTSALSYTLTPDNTTDKSLVWTSSDPAVATVSSAGTVTAVGPGSATITLSTGTPGVSAACDVTVVAPVESVTLDQTTLSLVVEDALTLTATVLPADTSYPTVTWTSSDTAVATVDETGLVTAVAPGTATVTATAGSAAEKKSAVCSVTVAAPDYTIEVQAVSFDVSAYGYAQPEAQALVLRSLGNRPATLSSVTLDNAAAFTLTGSGDTVPAGGTLTGYAVQPVSGLDPGSYSATVTVTYNGGDRATGTVAFTVIKADADYGDALVVTNAGAVSRDFTYGDTVQVTFLPRPVAALLSASPAENQAALYLGDTLLAGPVTADSEGKYVLTYDTAERLVPLGEQTLTFRYGGSETLNSGGTDLAVTLAARPLTAVMTELDLPAGGYAYDGGEKTPALAVTHDAAPLVQNEDYALAWADNVNAGTAAVTVTGQGWYSGQVTLTFSIAPQTGRELSLTAEEVLCADTAGQSFDLSSAVSALALDGDAPVYGGLQAAEGGEYLARYGMEEPGLVTFALADGLDGAYSAALTLEVTGLANYDRVAVTLTIPIAAYREVAVDLTGLTLADRTYDGQPLAWSGQPAGTWSGGDYAGSFSYTWRDAAGETLADAPVNAGSYVLNVAAADLGFRGEASRSVTIAPATVTAAAGDCQVSKVYDGTTAAGTFSGALDVTGLLPADSGVSVAVRFGEYESPDVGGQSALDAALSLTGDALGNYVLAESSLAVPCTITPKSAEVTALDQQIVYGEALSQDVSQAAAAGLLEGHRLLCLTLTPETSAVPGGALIPSAAQIVDDQGRDVTGNYDLNYAAGTLAVERRALTVTAQDAQVYRGRPLTDPAFTVEGLVAGDSFSQPQFTLADADEAGQQAILLSGGTLTHAESYTVTYIPGLLTVLEPALSLDQTRWDGATTSLTLQAAPEDLLTYQETLVFAARYEDGAMVELAVGAVTADRAVTFNADLTAQNGWKVFFLDTALSPLCAPLVLP